MREIDHEAGAGSEAAEAGVSEEERGRSPIGDGIEPALCSFLIDYSIIINWSSTAVAWSHRYGLLWLSQPDAD